MPNQDSFLIARSRANLEARAAKQIARDGGNAIVPQIDVSIKRNGKIANVRRPLMSQYLFVDKPPPAIRPIQRDWRYLIVNGKIAKVPASEVARMAQVCADLDKSKKQPKTRMFKRGQCVRIIAGPLGQQTASFCRYLSNGKRALVSIEGKIFGFLSSQLEAADGASRMFNPIHTNGQWPRNGNI